MHGYTELVTGKFAVLIYIRQRPIMLSTSYIYRVSVIRFHFILHLWNKFIICYFCNVYHFLHHRQEMIWYPLLHTCTPISMDRIYRTGYLNAMWLEWYPVLHTCTPISIDTVYRTGYLNVTGMIPGTTYMYSYKYGQNIYNRVPLRLYVITYLIYTCIDTDLKTCEMIDIGHGMCKSLTEYRWPWGIDR